MSIDLSTDTASSLGPGPGAGIGQARPRIRSGADKWLFVLTFVVGASGIVILKLNDYSQLIVTAWPVAVMLLYLTFLYTFRRFTLNDEQTGDAFYYLGFLFTLVSLALALWQFAGQLDAASHIITNFGIALATTIVGMAIRVFFSQLRRDPIEIERDARLELAGAASRLRSELEVTVLDFAAFRRQAQQVTGDAMAEIIERADQALARSGERTTEVAETAVRKMDEALATLAGTADRIEATAGDATHRLDSVFAAHAKQAERLGRLVDRTVGALEKLTARIEQIEAPQGLVTDRLKPLLDELEPLASAVRERFTVEQERDLRLAGALDGMVEASRTLQEGAATLIARTNELGVAGERLRGIYDQLGTVTNALHEGLESQQRLLAGQNDAIADRLVTLDSTLQQAAELQQRSGQELAHATDATGAALKQVIERIGQIEAPPDLITGRIEPLLSTLEPLAALSRERLATDAAREAQLASTVEMLSRAGQAIEGGALTLARSTESLGEAGERLRAAYAAMEGSAAALRESLDGQAQIIARQRQAIAEQLTALEADVGREGVARANALSAIDQAMGEVLAAVRRHNAAMDAELGQSRALARRTEESLVDAAQEIINRLNDPRYNGGSAGEGAAA